MRITKILSITAALCALCSCAKTNTSGINDANKRYFDSWIHIHGYDDCPRTPMGAVIIGENFGKGETIGTPDDSTFFRFSYTSWGLDGTCTNTTDARMAQQLGTYKEGNYYGPQIVYAGRNNVTVALEEIIGGMKPGGRRKVVVPGWLSTYTRHATPEEYIASESGTDAVYDIWNVEKISNIIRWEVDSIGRYLVKELPEIYGEDAKMAAADSAGMHGFFYARLREPESDRELTDTTVYINYIGRLLNGQVFDTTVRDTAVYYGIYNTGKTYGPVSISLGSRYSDVKMGSDENSVITGFAFGLTKMHPYEKGAIIFQSSWGYSYNGSGDNIPAYCPLRFDVELVKDPNS